MRADLVIDLSLLRASAASLDAIARELDRSDDRRDRLAEAWGSADVRAAMGALDDDWDDRRRRLVGDVGQLARLTRQCAEEMTRTDSGLADQLRDASS